MIIVNWYQTGLSDPKKAWEGSPNVAFAGHPDANPQLAFLPTWPERIRALGAVRIIDCERLHGIARNWTAAQQPSVRPMSDDRCSRYAFDGWALSRLIASELCAIEAIERRDGEEAELLIEAARASSSMTLELNSWAHQSAHTACASGYDGPQECVKLMLARRGWRIRSAYEHSVEYPEKRGQTWLEPCDPPRTDWLAEAKAFWLARGAL